MRDLFGFNASQLKVERRSISTDEMNEEKSTSTDWEQVSVLTRFSFSHMGQNQACKAIGSGMMKLFSSLEQERVSR